MTKEEMFKLIDKEVAIGQLAIDKIFQIVYNAGFNEGIDAVVILATSDYHITDDEILKLKK